MLDLKQSAIFIKHLLVMILIGVDDLHIIAIRQIVTLDETDIGVCD